MNTLTTSKTIWRELEASTEDGRRRRSDRSRRQIIEALFDLISEGNVSPSAASVAERAKVGLRTVFRHFEDMDSIYDEMTDAVMTAVMPMIVAPFESETWKERLAECIDRNCAAPARDGPGKIPSRPSGGLIPRFEGHRHRVDAVT